MNTQEMIKEEKHMKMDVIRKGEGELFTDPDPDHARAVFHQKSRKMVNKAMTLTKAIETFVHDGEYLALGGFGANRAPIAACYEILRQEPKNLGFAVYTTTHEFEILSAGEIFDKAGLSFRWFTDINEARIWLKSK